MQRHTEMMCPLVSTKSNKIVHLPTMVIDESQLFSLQAYTQVMPGINTWEPRIQIFLAGVPNGLTSSSLYYTDTKLKRYKKYHIPAHNNPYYTRADDIDNLKRYGGEDSDDYQRLVLGRHGSSAFSVISQDDIKTESYEFYSYNYTGQHAERGIHYKDVLMLHTLPPDVDAIVAGIDTGFVDPTIVSVTGRGKDGVWRYYVRYKLQRVSFPLQEEIIDWLDSFYNFDEIGLDIGSGGGGTQIMHSFYYRDQYQYKKYEKRLVPVQFGSTITVGIDTHGTEIVQSTKSIGASTLVQQLQQKSLRLSEIDHETMSQLTRITKQRTLNAVDKYYILSEKGQGAASGDDHIFASLICWAIVVRDKVIAKNTRRKLGNPRGRYIE